MEILDRGHGSPLVLVPGLQGRWEYLGPAVDALAESCRVLTFGLCGEPGSNPQPARPTDLACEADQIARLLDDRRIDRAAICGVSFGGLIALRFAAAHPDRTTVLILTSTPGPDFRLLRRHVLYSRFPRIFGALFLAEAPFRLRAEIKTALPGVKARLRFTAWQLRTLLRAPVSITRMARRAQMIASSTAAADARTISAPTLLVTGEPGLDRVVATAGTAKYRELIPHARSASIDRTGHLGSITRPHVFAAAVAGFLRAQDGGDASGRPAAVAAMGVRAS